ncbi:MAG: Nif3-like dinuclear metal center hexameric protein [Coriobacteriia bacterium]|nr:Nif3-like dinuclear metal center hexameric protein [Coriobacteriia bacterium]
MGNSGQKVESAEDRLEVVVAPASEGAVMAAAVAAHPYEEPLVVASEVRIARGAARMGRVGSLSSPVTLRVFAERVGDVFDCRPRVWGDPDSPVARVATATGSGGSLISDAIAARADVLLAGEVRYHDALNALAAGLAVVEAGHDVTEWPLIPVLADAVRATPGLAGTLVQEEGARRGWWVP